MKGDHETAEVATSRVGNLNKTPPPPPEKTRPPPNPQLETGGGGPGFFFLFRCAVDQSVKRSRDLPGERLKDGWTCHW